MAEVDNKEDEETAQEDAYNPWDEYSDDEGNGWDEQPDDPEEDPRTTLEEIDENGVATTAYYFTRNELELLYQTLIKVKNVVANQPITRGGSRCTEACDTENHHIHTYCTLCKKNFWYGTTIHDCKMGLGPG